MSYTRGPGYGGGGGVHLALPPLTPTIKQMLIVLAVSFAAQAFVELAGGGRVLADWLALSGVGVFGLRIWQLVTYAFLHGGIMHLLMNCLGLYMFGGDVERVLGSRGIKQLFVVAVVGGALLHVLVAALLGGTQTRVIGASAGVLGVTIAFAMLFPQRLIFLFPIPVPIRAWVIALVFAAINLYGAVSAAGGGIAYVAHLGGMAAGYFFVQFIVKKGGWPRIRFKRKSRKFTVLDGRPRDPWDIN